MGKAFLKDKKTTVRCNLQALSRELPGISPEEAWERTAESLREQGVEAAPLGLSLIHI